MHEGMAALTARIQVIAFVAIALIAGLVTGFSLGRGSTPDTSSRPRDAAIDGQADGTLIVDHPPNCDESTERQTIVQDVVDGPMSASWFGSQEQAIAQTFTTPGAGLRLTEVAPIFDYALGGGAILSVHEVSDPHDPMSGKELMRARLDSLSIPSGQPTRVRIDPPLALDCEAIYGIVIRPIRGSELGIQATAFPVSGNVYLFGAMFMGRPDRWDATGGDMRFEVGLAPVSGI